MASIQCKFSNKARASTHFMSTDLGKSVPRHNQNRPMKEAATAQQTASRYQKGKRMMSWMTLVVTISQVTEMPDASISEIPITSAEQIMAGPNYFEPPGQVPEPHATLGSNISKAAEQRLTEAESTGHLTSPWHFTATCAHDYSTFKTPHPPAGSAQIARPLQLSRRAANQAAKAKDEAQSTVLKGVGCVGSQRFDSD